MTGDNPTNLSLRLVCPECHTVCAANSTECPHCHLDLEWLSEVPDFREALAAWATPELCSLLLRVSWPGGYMEPAAQQSQAFSISVGPVGELDFELTSTWGPLKCCVGSSTKTLGDLPGELDWAGVKISARFVPRADVDEDPLPITEYRPQSIPLNVGRAVVMGRGIAEDVVQLPHPRVAQRHCLVARQPRTSRYWLVAGTNPGHGTYLNKQRFIAGRLAAGDLVQIGPFAWIFDRTDSEEKSGVAGISRGFLSPVRHISGVSLILKDVGVGRRLQGVNLDIRESEFVAVTGPSGGGKSTLIHAILESSDQGDVLADGHNARQEEEWFRGLLGYVSQREAIHPDLTARQVVEFSARVRGNGADENRIESLLRQADLDEESWDRACHCLSGGESKRLRVAAELIGNPRLLVLDEPGSGLDRGREQNLMRLLRALSHRGCTVVVVTHSLHHLEEFDRVLILRDRKRVFWDTPAKLGTWTPSGELEDLDLEQVDDGRSGESATTAIEQTKPLPKLNLTGRIARLWQQFCTLIDREHALLNNDPFKRLAVPLGLAPAFFALAIGTAVKPNDRELLGFLAILSCIWMGASLSLMSIVNEREPFEHERLLSLRVSPFVAAKTLALWLLSIVQTVLFVCLLSIVRSFRGSEAMLLGVGWCTFYLILVGMAAVGMGLIISALAWKNKPLANFLLPLVMMLQIVFSVQVAGQGDQPLVIAYGEFHPYTCQVASNCHLPAQRWMALPKDGHIQPSDGLFQWVCYEHAKITESRNPPNFWAILGSYLTLSRYGDIALRSFAYLLPEQETAKGRNPMKPDSITYGYNQWRHEASLTLLLLAFGLPCLVIPVLYWQKQLVETLERNQLWSALKRMMSQLSESWRKAVVTKTEE